MSRTGWYAMLRWVLLPIGLCMAGGVILLVLGHGRAGWLVANAGPMVYLLGLLAWITAVDSRRRWPDVAWQQRLTRVLSFHRDR